jgi:hypothetical protein
MPATQRTWCTPQKKKEPFTFAIFEFLHKGVSAAAMDDLQTLLGHAAAIFDCAGLGLHTLALHLLNMDRANTKKVPPLLKSLRVSALVVSFTLQSLANPSQAALQSHCPHLVHNFCIKVTSCPHWCQRDRLVKSRCAGPRIFWRSSLSLHVPGS